MKTSILLSGLLTLGTALSSHAGIIYEHTFPGTGSADLHGTAPETAPGAETWIGENDGSSRNIKNDGSWLAGINNSDDSNAFLPFTPGSAIYTLSVTVDQPTGSWVGFGFTQTASVGNDFWSNNTAAGTPWMLYRQAGNGQRVSFLGDGTGGSADEGNVSGTQTFSIVLDTTGANWTAEWFNGATSLRSETFAAPSTPIGYVGFGRDGVSVGSISDFTLTVIPEPSTFALVSIAVALSVLMCRRRR